MYTTSTKYGLVSYNDTVIQNIVGLTVMSCYGVVEMASVRRIRDYFFSNIQDVYFQQGITIDSFDGGIIDLQIHVVIGYSVPVKGVCFEIKKRVAFELEKILNIKVRKISVFVDAVDRVV